MNPTGQSAQPDATAAPAAPVQTPAQAPQTISVPPQSNGKHFPLKLVLAVVFLLAAAGVFFVLTQNQQAKETGTKKETVAKIPLTLSVDSPTDGTLVQDSKLSVKGKTSPHTTVVYYTDSDQGSIESDDSGMFEGNLTLVNGINTLTVTAYGDDGEEKTVTLDIVYDGEGVSQ